MQSIRHCVGKCSFLNNTILRVKDIASFNISRTLTSFESDNRSQWLKLNKKIFPISGPNEEKRMAYVCHEKKKVDYSPKKMWYIACFVRGMSIDEAIKQLSFLGKKGAQIVKETLLEAQEMAVKEHNVEFKSNLWVAESFVGKGPKVHGYRIHGRQRMYKLTARYCNYYVRLEEGVPPKNYYMPAPKSGEEMLNNWLKYMRSRKIPNSL